MIRIGDKHDCSGCGACVNACPKECISLRGDGEGFLYPEADPARCVECGLCESVCPFLAATEAREPSAVYAAVNPDGQERLQSSSGGVFPLLMRAVLEQGGIVFGAAFDEDWSVHHTAVTRLEEMPALQGSKYVQSRTGTCYRAVKECLRQGKRVLFSGTACQVAGLLRYLGKEEENLLTVDVVCHGVPSPRIWQEYLASLHQPAPIRSISFRDKQSGWLDYAFSIRYADGSVFREPHGENLYMKGYLKDLFLRPSCHRCKVKGGRCGSDITLGDFWGIGRVSPELDDDRGVSMVLAHTPKGLEAVRAAVPRLVPVTFGQAQHGNAYWAACPPERAWRQVFWRRFLRGEGLAVSVEKALRYRKWVTFFSRMRERLKERNR